MFKLCTSFAACLFLASAAAQAACEKVEHDPVDLTEYYADTVGRAGDDLKESLNEIIKGHEDYSYTPCVWEILKEADEDPANSSNIIAFYTGRSIPKSRQDTGSGDQDS